MHPLSFFPHTAGKGRKEREELGVRGMGCGVGGLKPVLALIMLRHPVGAVQLQTERCKHWKLKLTFSSSSLNASSACLTSAATECCLSAGSDRPNSTIAFSVALMVLSTSVVRSQRAAAVDF